MTDHRWNWDEETQGASDEPVFAEEPVFPEAAHDEPASEELGFDEPAFAEANVGVYAMDDAMDEKPSADEPTFAPPIGSKPIADPMDEALPQPKDAALPANRPIDPGKDAQTWFQDEDAPYVPRPRRLGRTGPFWLIGAGAALLILLVIWMAFGETGDEEAGAPVVTPVVAEGVAGSAALPTAEVVEPAPEEEPTPEPAPPLTAGQRVVVGNTGGDGIRLRNQPGLDGLTLAIYEDGTPFIIRNPDGDYEGYPVEIDGYQWYRIQVADNPDENLTGWVAGDFLVPAE